MPCPIASLPHSWPFLSIFKPRSSRTLWRYSIFYFLRIFYFLSFLRELFALFCCCLFAPFLCVSRLNLLLIAFRTKCIAHTHCMPRKMACFLSKYLVSVRVGGLNCESNPFSCELPLRLPLLLPLQLLPLLLLLLVKCKFVLS